MHTASFPRSGIALKDGYLSELVLPPFARQGDVPLEEQIVKALPVKALHVIIEKAAHSQLQQVFKSHLQESELHVNKVRQLLASQKDKSRRPCKVIHALVTEAHDAMKKSQRTRRSTRPQLDVALIGAAQQVAHHEMTVYGTLRNRARLFGRDE